MIAMVEALLAKNHAYEADGHVLFSVNSMPNYGELSGRNLDDMLAGARVEVADYKRHPGDFVLWKPAADDEPGWESPWGRGRPGWHLECSAMIHEHLGLEIDIHGGGRDLIFPHHENEIAQSCCAYGGSYVRYWMHNAYIDIDGEKMSKSLGNFKTIRELLGLYRGEVLRFALLSAHYRSSLNFSKELLDQSENALNGLYNALRKVESVDAVGPESVEQESWYAALCDDVNTPLAISELHQLISELNKADDSDKASIKGRILACASLLGILQSAPSDWLRGDDSEGLSAEAIDALVAERVEAKAAKNYARADEIRTVLTEAGVVLEDSPGGTTWRRA
jgi:cysteinyl-tRNA synthetase